MNILLLIAPLIYVKEGALCVSDHLYLLLIQDIIKAINNTEKSLLRIGGTIDLTRRKFFFLQSLF